MRGLISEKLLREAPEDSARMPSMVSSCDAGPKARSHCRGKRAVELLPESGTPGWATGNRNLRPDLCRTGEFDEAFRCSIICSRSPKHLTVPMLKLDPAWDPLRQDPRFHFDRQYGPKR